MDLIPVDLSGCDRPDEFLDGAWRAGRHRSQLKTAPPARLTGSDRLIVGLRVSPPEAWRDAIAHVFVAVLDGPSAVSVVVKDGGRNPGLLVGLVDPSRRGRSRSIDVAPQ